MPAYKNHFSAQTYVEEEILDDQNNMIGTFRLKPSTVLWKPSGKGKYLAVSLDEFIKWITIPTTKAKQVAY